MLTKGAMLAIDDMLDNCCELKAGQEVVIAAEIDGLHGGDNLVDEETVEAIRCAVTARGANCTVIWFEEVAVKDKWRVPPVFMAALKASDVFINCTFDLTIEEMPEIQKTAMENGVVLCRNFATTMGLLNSPWAQTPYELVTEIRYQSALPFGSGGMPFEITAPNGSHLEGIIDGKRGTTPSDSIGQPYAKYRKDIKGYRPFPEWVFPPINLKNVNGVYTFDRTLGWWARYVGIPPVFSSPVTITVEDCVITSMTGGEEADLIMQYLRDTEQYFDDAVYKVMQAHCGVHPCTVVAPQQCSHPLYRRLIEHSGSNLLHIHLGDQWANEKYPYRVHFTADLKEASWKVGDTYVMKDGQLTALEAPSVKALMEKYQGRPGTCFLPRNY